MEYIKEIIESLLFVSETPLSVKHIKSVLPMLENHEIHKALEELSQIYDDRKAGFYLSQVAGGYQLRTRPDYSDWIRQFLKPSPSRLSKAALETLTIIAYKQPIIRNDIEQIRGVDSGGVIRLLLEKKLIRVLGRKEIPGRPLIYSTTKQFLELFDLKDLKDLPTPKEIEELGKTFEPLELPFQDNKDKNPETYNAEDDEGDLDTSQNIPENKDSSHLKESGSIRAEDQSEPENEL